MKTNQIKTIFILLASAMNVSAETLATPFTPSIIESGSIEINPSALKNILQQLPKTKAVEQSASSISTMSGPAPQLSYLHIYAIYSALHGGWEYLAPTQIRTNYYHGGNPLIAVTIEIGYGFSQKGRINNGTLPASANYRNDAICWDAYGTSLVSPCSAGETVAGYFRYWNLTGDQGTTFTYQNTSENYPWTTLSAAIFIK